MRHPEFPIVSFLCVPLVLASLPSHWRAKNVATVSLIFWLSIMSIIRGVNAIAWAGNVDIKMLIWCDITGKIQLGFTYAVPASALCIVRRLEAVSSTRATSNTAKEKRNRFIFEVFMCFILPIIFMPLTYIVQGHRLDILEDIGCSLAIYISVQAIIILWLPPLLMSSISFIYAGLALRHFLRHRVSFATHLRNSQSAISSTHYFRLMALAIVEMTWDTGANIYVLYLNVAAGLRPWISWDDVHSNFSRIQRTPNFLLPTEVMNQFIFTWWIVPISCLFFFIFLGIGEEATADYRRAWAWICRVVFRRGPQPKFENVERLPQYRSNLDVPTPTIPAPAYSFDRRRKSIDNLSFKTTSSIADLESGFSNEKMIPTPTTAESFDREEKRVSVAATLPEQPTSTRVVPPGYERFSMPPDFDIVLSAVIDDSKRQSWPLDKLDELTDTASTLKRESVGSRSVTSTDDDKLPRAL